MKAEEYLRGIRRKDREITGMQGEIDYLKDRICSLRSAMTGHEKVQHSSDPDRTGSLMAKIDEKEREIIKKIDQLADLRQEAYTMICQLDNDIERDVLISIYLNYKNMYDTMEAVDRTINTVRHRKTSGLRSLENKFPDFFNQDQ